MNAINKNFKKLRKDSKLLQKQFAEKLGVTLKMVGSYEEGRGTPKMNVIKKAVDTFKISRNDLYDFLFDENFEVRSKGE